MVSHKMISFICSKNKNHLQISNGKQGSGLQNSSEHAAKSLNSIGHQTKISCVDNFEDLYMASSGSDFVFIQAIWVSLYDLKVLKAEFNRTRFVIQVRSNIPFLANETNSYKYIKEATEAGIDVAFNDKRAQSAMAIGIVLENMFYPRKIEIKRKQENEYLDFGCFGSVRPMKNTFIQALAAIKYAEKVNKTLRFHINSTRIEGGNPALSNLLGLFEGSKHRLIGAPWMCYEDFLKYMNGLDLCLQVSLTESFNYVMADSVYMKVASVGTSDMGFLFDEHPDKGCADSIVRSIEKTIHDEKRIKYNFNALAIKHGESVNGWKQFLEEKKIVFKTGI